MTSTAKLIALCPAPLAADACKPASDIALVKSEIELFNNATWYGRTKVTIGDKLVRGFAFKATAATATGVARVFGRSVYRVEVGPAAGCYFIARDSDRGLCA
jgi:hypothetical protein